jgi:hypothetical protein
MHQPNGSNAGVDNYGDTIVSGRELAAILGLSEAHIFTLRRRGIVQQTRARKNEYQLGPSVRAYVQFKAGENPAQVDLYRERALKEAANRELRQILVQQTRDQLHRGDDVRAIVEDSNNEIRTKLLAFAKRLAGQITGKHDPTEVKDRIESSVRELLSNLSKYRACDYYRRSKIAHLKAEQSQDESQPEKEAVKKEQPAHTQPEWPEGKARSKGPRPWIPEANRARMAEAAKQRCESMPLEERSAQLTKMRAGRRPGYGKRAWATRRQRKRAQSGGSG